MLLLLWPLGRFGAEGDWDGVHKGLAGVRALEQPEAAGSDLGGDRDRRDYFGILDERNGDLYLFERNQVDWRVVTASGEL